MAVGPASTDGWPGAVAVTSNGGGVTALSHVAVRRRRVRAMEVVLARCWLMAVIPTMTLTGCVLPEPPDFERRSTPPFLWAPSPATTKVLIYQGNEIRQFNALVRSEDPPGDDLWGFLFLNYRIAGLEERQPGTALVEAATLSDSPRLIDIGWRVPVRTPGACEQLSLVVSHRSNFAGDLPVRDDDVAILTWWVDINATDETLGQCPHGAGGAK